MRSELYKSNSGSVLVGMTVILSLILGIGIVSYDRLSSSSFFHADSPAPAITPEPPKIKNVKFPMSIKGIDAGTFRKGKKILRLRTDFLMVNPRRFPLFQIRTLNEVTLHNTKIENFLGENLSLVDVGFLSFFESLLQLGSKNKSTTADDKVIKTANRSRFTGMGIITRGVIIKLNWHIYKEGKPYFLVTAQKAYIDFNKKKTELHMGRLENFVTKEVYKSKLIIWDNKKKYFYIPKNTFAISTNGKKVHRQGIEVKLK